MEIRDALEKFKKSEKTDLWYQCVRELYETEKDYESVADLRKFLKENMTEENRELLLKTYDLTAKEVFRDYCIAVEWGRPIKDRFYLPRQKGLSQMVDALQELADDKLDCLCISCPPGIGKTGLALYFICWLAGRNPKDGILCGSHSSSILKGMYKECLREMTSDEYRWADIFHEQVVDKDAADLKIDVEKEKRFSSVQFASIEAMNAGKCRAMQLLYCDDLIGGIEEALSKDRLDAKWSKYNTDYRQRKQGDCKELHIATRWSVHDIIGRIEAEHDKDPRYKFISLSALDENDESNFDYGNGIGFTTEFYHDIRQTMDKASFEALYMNHPVEREGLLYEADSLRTYYSYPVEVQPDAILGVCDTAEGGGDDTVMPIFAVYGNDHYLIDVVCSNELPEVTDALCANMLIKRNVQKCQFESNSAGGRTADKVEELVKKRGGRCHITKKRTTAQKLTKIIVNSDWIKEHCLFLDQKCIQRGSMYFDFMRKLTTFTRVGKNQHDDVPDALAQYALFYQSMVGNVVQIYTRIF